MDTILRKYVQNHLFPITPPKPKKYHLPLELLLQVVKYLKFTDVLSFRLVCKYFSIVSISSVFASMILLLPSSGSGGTRHPFLHTGLFYRSASEITIAVRSLPANPLSSLQRSFEAREPTKYNAISSAETGLLQRTTSVLSNLSKITLNLADFDRARPEYYGSFFVAFFKALYLDPDKAKIKSITINALPLWILQRLRREEPQVLCGALTHVKQLSVSFVPILEVEVNDRINFYYNYKNFTSTDKSQLYIAYDAVRAFLISAGELEELAFSWFSSTQHIAGWKALSPIGDLTSLCKPSAGADAARFIILGCPAGGSSWTDSEGRFTVVWQSLRVLKLSKLITCRRQLLTAILGAKYTLRELELSDILLNMSCGEASWHSDVIIPLWKAMAARSDQKEPLRLEICNLSQLGYTSGLGQIPKVTLASWATSLVS